MDTKDTMLELLAKIEELQSALAVNTSATESENRRLKLTEQEILQMPKNVRKKFRIQGREVRYRIRRNGRYVHSVELIYTRDGYNVSASGRTIELAKQRFIEKMSAAVPKEKSALAVPTNFDAFAMYWFENFHKRKVKENTYRQDVRLYERHVKSAFEKLAVKDINPIMLQSFLDKFANRLKTADDLHSQLNQILNSAVKHGLIKLSPLGMVFHQQHKRKHGKALTKIEEQTLLKEFEGTPYQLHFAVILYTGLRPNEYPTAVIEGDFIKAINSKRHGQQGEVVYKYIPITPMLKPYLVGVENLNMPQDYILEDRFKKALPNHKPYDMRTTFQTRCTECGVSEVAIGLFMGNSIGGELKKAYTDVSDEYLLREGKKIQY